MLLEACRWRGGGRWGVEAFGRRGWRRRLRGRRGWWLGRRWWRVGRLRFWVENGVLVECHECRIEGRIASLVLRRGEVLVESMAIMQTYRDWSCDLLDVMAAGATSLESAGWWASTGIALVGLGQWYG